MRVKGLRFVDNIELMTTSEEEANYANSLNENCRKYGMEINVDKTKVMPHGWNKQAGGGARWSRSWTSQRTCVPRFNHHRHSNIREGVNPLELSPIIVNMSESSAVWPRLETKIGHVDFFGIASVLFIFNSYNVHWFYRELNSLHIGLKIKHIFNMKVDHICVGTREIQSTTSRWSWRRWHWQCRPDIWKPRSTSNES